MTPLIDKQPVEYVEHMADGVASKLFSCRDYCVFERHFVKVVIREMMKLNAKNDARALPTKPSNNRSTPLLCMLNYWAYMYLCICFTI